MNKRLKIAIYSGTIPGTAFIENLIKGLAHNDLTVYIFGKKKAQVFYKSPNIKLYATPKHKGLNILMTFFRSFMLLLKFPKRFFILINTLSNYNSLYSKWNWWSRYVPVVLHLPEVFHIQWAKDLEYWAFLKDKFKVKLIVSLRGAHINYSPIADKQLAGMYKNKFPEVDAFHAVSNAIAIEAQKYGAAPIKIKMIHSVLHVSLFEKFSPYQKKTANTIELCSVGRFHWKKGYKYALDAMYNLKQKNIDIKYTIIASNGVSESILFQIQQLDLADNITILKSINQDQLFEKMKTFDMLLLPSVEEGIANVVLEAMAIGVPVISTNCGGMAEVVHHKETGWLVPVRDPKSIAEAVIELSETSEQELQRMTKNAHDFVKAEFNAEDSIEQFLELYDSVLSN